MTITISDDVDSSPVTPAVSVTAVVARLAGAIGALTIVAYQSWFMPFFQPFFAGREWLARPVFYALYGSILVATAAVLATRPDIRRKVLPYAIAAAIGIAVVVLHPVGLVTKAYLITLFLGGAAVVLTLASAPRALLCLSASVTALSAVLCLFDLLIVDGFTNTAGRAAGLAINPNVAAAGVLLGTAASYRAVPARWLPSFLVLVGAAIFVTLSRSMILTALVTVGVTVAVDIWWRKARRAPFPMPTAGFGPAAALAVVLVAWIGLTLATNDRFRLALDGSVTDTRSARAAINAAEVAVAVTIDEAPVAKQELAIVKIEAIGKRLEDEGQRNSISARTLFLDRGLLAYWNNGFFGSGIEVAHGLAPHNTFVLFAIAFGHLGWLIPLGVVGFAFAAIRDPRDLPLGLTVVGTMMTTHDILVTPSLFLPIALGMALMLAGREDVATAAHPYRSIAWGAASGAVLFVIGCLAILFVSPPLAVERLRAEAMSPFRDAYAVSLQPPLFAGIFRLADTSGVGGGASSMREGPALLSRVDWSPAARPAVKAGEYTVRVPDTLLFAPSDASDPRRNGRSYEVGLPLTVSPLFYVLLGTIALWCVGMARMLACAANPARQS